MDNTNSIEHNSNAEAPAGVAPGGAKKAPKPKEIEPAAAAKDQSSQSRRSVAKRTAVKPITAKGAEGGKAKKLATKHADKKPATRNRGKSKKEQLIGLLSKPGGARVSVLVDRLGWQAHTVRAALSGLRKQGLAISTSKSAKTGKTVYAITSASNTAETNEASA